MHEFARQPHSPDIVSGFLSLAAVACRRGRTTLFSGIDVTLGAGQLLRVEGDNGAGKTSLLKIASGLLLPTAGEVRWRGTRIDRLRDSYSAELVYLGHGAALKDDLSVMENLDLATRLAGVRCSAPDMLDALGAAGLSGKTTAMVRTLSQGQRRRAALARLVLSKDKLLWILDEPFNALDKAAVVWLLSVIEAHLARGGLAILTSHQGVAFSDHIIAQTVQL